MRFLARLTYLRAGTVIAFAVVLLAGAAVLAAQVFDRVEPFDISDPESEVSQASEAFEAATGRAAEPGVVLLVDDSPSGEETDTVVLTTRALRSVPGIAEVDGPESDPALVSADGSRSLILGFLETGAVRVDVGEAVEQRFGSDPAVLAGGTSVAAYQVGLRSESDTRRLELYAAPLLLILLLIVFRTVIAAMLPLVVAAMSILATFAALTLITELTAIDLFALQTVTGLGVGLAIDYSLFILARYRQEIAAGRSHDEAHLTVLQTAGKTVAFSSLTVAAALFALVAFPQPFLHSTGIAGALTALFAGLTALLVLPAILAVLGNAVNRMAIRGAPETPAGGEPGGFWRRLPELVCRRPIPAVLAGTITMLALSSQVFGTELVTPDARELPAEESARVVDDSLSDFPGVPPTRLFAIVPDSLPQEGPDLVVSEIDLVAGVTSVSQPQRLDDGSSQIHVTAAMDPLSEEGQDLVTDLREVLPPEILLGGRAAEQADQRSSIFDNAPIVAAIVVITNLFLLALMTRSLLLPLLALAVNLLTVAASLGALVLMFTTEWGAALVGTDVQTGIDISVPVIAFAVGFGLSTDYGIFLFARIREERGRSRTEEEAIIEGVAATGRLISASALLLGVAVGAFVFSDLVIVKEFAVAIAVAVLLDATVVRGLLIPGVLSLIGRRAWWPGDRRGLPTR